MIRALWTGGPVTRPSPFYPLEDAHAFPVPTPPPPIIIGGETPAGARLAGRIGDGWSAFEDNFEQNLPLYLEALEASGRRREDQRVSSGSRGDWLGDADIAESPWCRDPRDDVGALARGRRGRRDRPRPHDRGRRRAGRPRPIAGRRPGRPRPTAADRRHRRQRLTSRCPTPPATPDRPHPRLRPLRRAGSARRRAVRALQPARAARRGELPGPRDGLPRRSGSRSSVSRLVAQLAVSRDRAVPRRGRRRSDADGGAALAVTLDGHELRHAASARRRAALTDPAVAGGKAAFVQSPRIEPGATITFDATRRRSSARRLRGRSPSSAPTRDGAAPRSRLGPGVRDRPRPRSRGRRLLMDRYERVERVDYKSARDIVTEVDHLSARS